MRVVRNEARPPVANRPRERRRVERREEADGQVEGQRAEGDEQQEEEVLHDKRLGLQNGRVGGRVARRCDVRGCWWEEELLDARPGEVHVEEEEQDSEAED